MPYLGLDTATARGSVALALPGEILAEAALQERAGHARDLLSRIDELLKARGLKARDLIGIGVAAGPGSFTGIRVGMATAKGLAYALQIGLAGISTLEAIARETRRAHLEPAGGICATMEAGRGEIYAALFRAEAGEPLRSTPDRSCRPADLVADLPEGVMLAGDAAERIWLMARQRGRALVAPLVPCPLLAGAIALWAGSAIAPGAGYPMGSPGPNYVRPSDAEAARRRS